MIAIYPGSFDPPTYGHLDIIKRAARFSDTLIVAVLNNFSKNPMFNAEERKDMLREAVRDIKNVEIDSFSGLLADYVKNRNACLVIRGLRAITDFEYEFQMALTNRMMDDRIETLFISTSMEYLYLSSSIVKEIARLGGDVKKMVPPAVEQMLLKKIGMTR